MATEQMAERAKRARLSLALWRIQEKLGDSPRVQVATDSNPKHCDLNRFGQQKQSWPRRAFQEFSRQARCRQTPSAGLARAGPSTQRSVPVAPWRYGGSVTCRRI